MTSLKRFGVVGFCLLCGFTGAAPSGARSQAADVDRAPAIENSVVKVFATMRYPDPFKPWTKQAPSEVTASGVVIEGKRILTNAHVVLYASQVQIQANAAGDKVPATVVAVAPGIDLAVLKLDDAAFFDTHPPVARASKLPQIKDAVLAYGFPTGGNSLSITKGIVSRIEFVAYNYPVSGLRIQVDAAINPGNSGGPAIAGDKMIGLAFSKLGGDTQNIGYIIPNEEVELFLKDIADGPYHGKPAIYDELQTLENPALREYLKLDKSVEGMIVHRPDKTDAAYPLKEWDVLTRIGDTPIDNQGMIKLDRDLRVSFAYMVQHSARDGKLPMTVVRAGKSMKIDLPVSAEHPTLVTDLRGGYPSYFIYGPLVFSTATWQLVSSFENNAGLLRVLGAVKSPLVTRAFDPPDADSEELVVISSPFFPHKLSNGYSNPAGSVVRSVNGTHVRSLKHLVTLLRDLKDPFVTIEFDQKGNEALVFSRTAMLAATDEILTDNGVRAQGSPNMMEVWQEKTGK
jgi:S1-C subfamily serine protease